MNSDARWQQLRAAGLVTGDAPGARAQRVSWAIGAMLGIAAWLAALFVLFFLGIALEDVVRQPMGALAVGLAVCAVAVLALRSAGERVFAAQLALAFSLAGQALVLVGLLMDAGRGGAGQWWLFALFEALLVAVASHAGHRVLATLACALAVMMALSAMSAQPLFLPLVLAAFVGVEACALAARPPASLWHPLAIGLVLALLAAMAYAAVPELWQGEARPAVVAALRWIGVAILTIASAAAGIVIVRDATGRSKSHAAMLAGAALAAIAVAAFWLPGIAAAAVVLLLAFAAGHRVLAALAIVALVASLSHYYYRLDTTLLVKAANLLALGVLLLLAQLAVTRLVPGRIDHA